MGLKEIALEHAEQRGLVRSSDAGSAAMYLDTTKFEQAQRAASLLAKSGIVPDGFKNNVAATFVVLGLAEKLQIDPFIALQNMYFVHGKPAIESKLIIGMFNERSQFEPLRYRMTKNEKSGAIESCCAYAKYKPTGDIYTGPMVTIEMAQKEKWGSKWQTMPDLMFRYRSAVFFIRTYAPEVIFGMHSKDELDDIIDITPKDIKVEIVDPEPETAQWTVEKPEIALEDKSKKKKPAKPKTKKQEEKPKERDKVNSAAEYLRDVLKEENRQISEFTTKNIDTLTKLEVDEILDNIEKTRETNKQSELI